MVHLPKLESDETSEAADVDEADPEPITVEMIGESDEIDEISQVRRQTGSLPPAPPPPPRSAGAADACRPEMLPVWSIVGVVISVKACGWRFFFLHRSTVRMLRRSSQEFGVHACLVLSSVRCMDCLFLSRIPFILLFGSLCVCCNR